MEVFGTFWQLFLHTFFSSSFLLLLFFGYFFAAIWNFPPPQSFQHFHTLFCVLFCSLLELFWHLLALFGTFFVFACFNPFWHFLTFSDLFRIFFLYVLVLLGHFCIFIELFGTLWHFFFAFFLTFWYFLAPFGTFWHLPGLFGSSPPHSFWHFHTLFCVFFCPFLGTS